MLADPLQPYELAGIKLKNRILRSATSGYIRDCSEADFSHSICPECAEKLYPGVV